MWTVNVAFNQVRPSGTGLYYLDSHYAAYRMGRVDREIKAMIDYIKSCPPAEGTEEVLIAGEPERIAMKQRKEEGIFVDDSTWEQIESTAKHVGIPEEEAKAMIS